jgi:hypothetical protein
LVLFDVPQNPSRIYGTTKKSCKSQPVFVTW